MRLLPILVVACVALAGCTGFAPPFGTSTDGATGGTPPPVSIEPITVQDIYTAMIIAGVDPAAVAPADMTMKQKRIVAGICFGSAKVHTSFDEQADAICGPLLAEFYPPVPAPKPDE